MQTETKKVEQNTDIYESAFAPVPESQRKTLLSLTAVLAGYPIALSNFVIGGAAGVGLTFDKALLALFIGNGILIAIVIITGLMAYETGLSTAFLSRRAFGKNGSSIFSLLLAMSSVTWISLNGDIFSRLIKTTFPWWPISIPITAVIVILIWMQSAIRGYKGLEVVSFIGVPAALIMSLVGVIAAFNATNGFAGLTSYIPEKPMSFTAATASIVGGWVFGATITPDICRFAKSKRDVVIAGLVAFIVGCFGLQLAGALVALATGQGDFTLAMAELGLTGVAFVAAIFCLWTTQDNNIYGASLAIQNVLRETSAKGKVSHMQIAIAVAGVSAVFAALGIYKYILPIIQFLSVLIPPVPGLLTAEYYFVKNSKENITTNWLAMLAWVLGGTTGYISLKTNFFIPPVVGMVAAGVIYTVLSKLFDK
ncbi:Permease for cytosine/purines uracil thiamine allantoin [Tepidanaerobacter acetatoxydans Re1]|uniref:Permease for cytosine/purines uracil thiamine allantoin n=1 Tax=Tepidanaerobacter acetatoxydans (strain DSM 21804 / JCM 16047 / Re1) TaxID=1209989 RepID=F4LUN9_TEPAE|nr:MULTISPECIES: cytosine permease [Tepidanaerobacter]AEE90607.1 permease for cytosine/purines uracil thiamine allantoin [Tepidanaerobacter acetatoxydans Re1]CCP25128.1 Permease for cytosine/purines uracil thiamine allantoin [Tepidanaerobacter acetatoxydans Re1]